MSEGRCPYCGSNDIDYEGYGPDETYENNFVVDGFDNYDDTFKSEDVCKCLKCGGRFVERKVYFIDRVEVEKLDEKEEA